MIATPLVERLGWTLLHSIWQLGLIALLFGLAQWLLRGRSADVRYLLTMLTLLAMLGAPVGTCVWLSMNMPERPMAQSLESRPAAIVEGTGDPQGAPSTAIGADGPLVHVGPSSSEMGADRASDLRDHVAVMPTAPAQLGGSAWFRTLRTTVEPLLPGLVGLWLAGVLLLSGRHLGGWWAVERLRRRGTVAAPPPLQALMDGLGRQLGVRRRVQLLESMLVTVPSVVGWFRPVVLLPLSLATRLPADQLEAILLHELAHIRRCDYLANGVQIAAETLLFHHPAVWWVSWRMRLERECCADELAAAACGNRLLYAKALTNLEDQRDPSPGWAVAANGSDLRRRIERVLGLHRPPSGHAGHWVTGTAAALLLLIAALAAPWGAINANDETPSPVAVAGNDSPLNDDAPDQAAEALPRNPTRTGRGLFVPAGTPQQPAGPAAQEQPPALGERGLGGLGEILDSLVAHFVELAFAPSAPLDREYVFQLQTSDDSPVAGATVTLNSLGLSGGSSLGGFPEGLIPAATSADDGTVRIDLSKFHESPLYDHLSRRLSGGVEYLNLQVGHPEHPPLATSVWVAAAPASGVRKIVLSESRTVDIRARREGDETLLRDLVPRLRGADGNWSQTDGVLTIRRLDLTSRKASRWLRVVHAPEQGAVLFSDVIDLQQFVGDPVSVEVSLKPGVPMTGRLSDEVPRPVKNGRVIAAVYSGPDHHDTVFWGTVAEVSPEGTFVLQPLPANADVQIIALCDGWVSQSPTLAELDAYVESHGFPLHPSDRQSYQISGLVHPRLHRLSDPAAPSRPDIVIPMERTATCEIAVVDQDGNPIPQAEVFFNPSPSQSFFRGGTFYLGTGWDSFAIARSLLTTGEEPQDRFRATMRSWKATTNEQGMAVVSHLAGGWSRSNAEVQFPISVIHPDYVDQGGIIPLAGFAFAGQSVTLSAGEAGRVTLRLQRR